MLNDKEAVKKATDYLRHICETEEVKDILLEGLQRRDKPPKRWIVTLSFLRFPERLYRRIDIDAEKGDVKSMRPVAV